MIGAARVFGQMHNSAGAEMLLKESLKLARELKSSALIAETYFALAANYEIMTEPGKALASFKQYLKAKESFNSSEIQSRLSNIEVTHAIEKSEQEKEIYRLKHVELKKAYDLIEEKNMDITANIQYATRIQQAMLPDMKNIKGLERRSFVLYIPKDVVSGDFYWFARVDKKLVIAAADCTGHGVPGALMSMLGISFLEEIVNTRKITDTSIILEELGREVVRALHQKGDRQEARDGMDIALCILDKNTMQYSGAHNNLYLIRNNGLTEYKADWLTVGFNEPDKRFSRQIIRTLPGDIIYLFSDGYADQFGGPDRKKFRYSNLKSLLLRIHDKPMRDQKKALEKEFYKWKGIHPQIDDVLIMGYRI